MNALDFARLYIDAAEDPTGANLGAAGAALDIEPSVIQGGIGSVVPPGNIMVVPAGAWTGDALIGQATLDGDYDSSGSWFTDLDITATFSVLPHQANDTGQWCELFHIPFTGGGGATEWGEFAVIFRDNGDLWIGFDFESGSEMSVGDPTWVSGEVYTGGAPQPLGVVGDWHDGLAEATWRLTIVAATGAVTLRKDGVVVVTDTMGAVSFPEPPAGEVVQAGGFEYMVALKSVSLKAGLGGAEIIGFDASDLTGWTLSGTSSVVSTPTDAGFYGTITVPDDPALTVAAGEDATFAFWFTTTLLADVNNEVYYYALWESGTFGVNLSGLRLWDARIDGFGIDGFGAVVSDGIDAVLCMSNTGWAAGTHLVVVAVDRGTGTLTVYRDGVAHATCDITAVGALNAAADLALDFAAHHAVAKWDSLIDPALVASAREAEIGDTLDVLTLAEAKAALKITDTTNDDRLASAITAVSRRLDDEFGPIVKRTIAVKTYQPAAWDLWVDPSPIYATPALTVTEYDRDGTAQVLTLETYATKPDHGYRLEPRAGLGGGYTGRIRRTKGTIDSTWGTVRVTYDAGRYASTATVDPVFKEAARVTLEHWWTQVRPMQATPSDLDLPSMWTPRWALPDAVIGRAGIVPADERPGRSVLAG